METRTFARPHAFPALFHLIPTLTTRPQMASEPRKIMETRKRFLEEKFPAGRKAEAVVQGLLRGVQQLPLDVGRVDAGFLGECEKGLKALL